MNNRQPHFFIGKCLTLGRYPERIPEVRDAIRSGKVNWELMVWVSTGAYVFTALHLQLKRAGLLAELPTDLVEYMEEFTNLNRERNRAILDQALEVNTLLHQNNIIPIFLKGAAHLLDGLYEDPAERMIGDIDFLVDEKDMVRAAGLLIRNGYESGAEYNPKHFRMLKHYPRLFRDDRPADVEVHRRVVRAPYEDVLDYQIVSGSKRKSGPMSSAFVPGNSHQIIHDILNYQVNDRGYYHGEMFLRQSYDLFLLSSRENPLQAVRGLGKLFHCLNANLAINNKILGNPGCLTYEKNWQSNLFSYRPGECLRFFFIHLTGDKVVRFGRAKSGPVHSGFSQSRKGFSKSILWNRWI